MKFQKRNFFIGLLLGAMLLSTIGVMAGSSSSTMNNSTISVEANASEAALYAWTTPNESSFSSSDGNVWVRSYGGYYDPGDVGYQSGVFTGYGWSAYADPIYDLTGARSRHQYKGVMAYLTANYS